MNINLFKKIETEEDAYWLGFLYADDNVSNVENKIELILSICDYSHIDKIKKYSVYCHNIKAFLDYLYKDANIYLDRKYEHYQDFLLNGAQVYNKFAVQ